MAPAACSEKGQRRREDWLVHVPKNHRNSACRTREPNPASATAEPRKKSRRRSFTDLSLSESGWTRILSRPSFLLVRALIR